MATSQALIANNEYAEPQSAYFVVDTGPLIAPQPPYNRPTEEKPPNPTEDLIREYAALYALDPKEMAAVVACESNFVATAVGDGGKSHGLVQIYLPAHPAVSKQQAYNPDFAIRFLAQHWAAGKQHLWTCARNLGY